jgi:hypothetical protein
MFYPNGKPPQNMWGGQDRVRADREVREECRDAMEADFEAVRDEFRESLQDEVDRIMAEEWSARNEERKAALLMPLLDKNKEELAGLARSGAKGYARYEKRMNELEAEAEAAAALAAEHGEFQKERRPQILNQLMEERKAELEEMMAPVREAWADRIRVAADERMAEQAEAARKQEPANA